MNKIKVNSKQFFLFFILSKDARSLIYVLQFGPHLPNLAG